MFFITLIPLLIIDASIVHSVLKGQRSLIVFILGAVLSFVVSLQVSAFTSEQWISATTAFSRYSNFFQALQVAFFSCLTILGVGVLMGIIWFISIASLTVTLFDRPSPPDYQLHPQVSQGPMSQTSQEIIKRLIEGGDENE